MTMKIVRQPDGDLAMWSTVVDSWMVVDASEKEMRAYYMEVRQAAIEREADAFFQRFHNQEAFEQGERESGLTTPDHYANLEAVRKATLANQIKERENG